MILSGDFIGRVFCRWLRKRKGTMHTFEQTKGVRRRRQSGLFGAHERGITPQIFRENQAKIANPSFPLQHSKNAPNHKLVQICPSDRFGGFLRRTGICQKYVKIWKTTISDNSWHIFNKSSPPWLEAPKTIAGTDVGQLGFGAFWNAVSQEPLNAPFLNGLFSSGFSKR